MKFNNKKWALFKLVSNFNRTLNKNNLTSIKGLQPYLNSLT